VRGPAPGWDTGIRPTGVLPDDEGGNTPSASKAVKRTDATGLVGVLPQQMVRAETGSVRPVGVPVGRVVAQGAQHDLLDLVVTQAAGPARSRLIDEPFQPPWGVSATSPPR
jgi:hypothetical protein